MYVSQIGVACAAALLLIGACASAAPTADRWVLRADGYGPLRYGMTLAQVRKRVGQLVKVANSCDYYEPVRRPEIGFVFESGRLVSAGDRSNGLVKTAHGLSQGVSDSRLKRRYPGHVTQDFANYDLPSQPGSTSYVADVDEGTAYNWRFYVENGKVTHVESSYASAKDLCVD